MYRSLSSLSLSFFIASVKKLRMKKASYVVLCAMAVVAMLLFEAPLMAKAVTCSPLQLSSCIAAITSSAPPSSTCCTKLREQRPCLCGYLKDPNLRQYVNSPGARKVASTCGVPFPSC
ncbi:non-specific lipid-transfer protein 2-like [Quercus lobata]|nr:non-specific lipid-transfer protein 2-like [Quercus lobata]XP_030966657.1 non-specific lipid-transfer protein 2-like [Quercus lobata]